MTHPAHAGPRLAGLTTVVYEFTLEEIAQDMGISRERVRQLEARALVKARRILTERGFNLADFLEHVHHG